ncbi:ABC transporter ATP-binding protein [Myxococcota bacterium]|nr:ABC transporter ATP-binding protein [Myxococcota bacterium]
MITIENVTKSYTQGAVEVTALRGVSLVIERGRFVSIMGPSGSGKSTLLHLVGALDRPTTGAISIDGQPIQAMSDDERTLLRRERIGFVFQFFNLLPTLSAIENVCLPALLANKPRDEVLPRAKELLQRFGLGHRIEHRSTALSGGEMQRVAVARALIMSPPVILADEPTGNLDSKTGQEILELLRHASRELGRTIVMVTHDAKAASYGDSVIELADGRVVEHRAVVA